MANNRMYLENTLTGDKIYLAKYFPTTGWACGDKNMQDTMNDGFAKSEENYEHLGMCGCVWKLRYEDEDEVIDYAPL